MKKAGNKVLANNSKSNTQQENANRTANGLIAVIGDEDTVTGMLLSGIGYVDARQKSNFFVVDSKTTPKTIDDKFREFTTKRNDIAIILINQHVAMMIRETVEAYDKTTPAVLQIPSKEHPYDPEQDAIHRRTKLLLGIRD